MQATNILIVEDHPKEAQILKQQLLKNGYRVTGIADTLQMALELLHNTSPDIVIIDIMLNGRSEGLTFARTLQLHLPDTPFVFLTSMTDRDTFEKARLTGPYGYLLKPFNEIALQYALELALERSGNSAGPIAAGNPAYLRQKEALFVKRGNSLVKVLIKDILFLEVDGKYCSIVTAENKLLVFRPLSDMLELLPTQLFARVHRNFIVNLQEIRELNVAENYILLLNGRQVDMSRRYKEQLMKSVHMVK